ncbi:MAG: hypothetical protein H7251_17780, partial [Acetobacteraceae bacterium]|nr:hypothetical protein [Acetobacteraceae bacterium]
MKRAIGSAFAGIVLAITTLVGLTPDAAAQCTANATGNWNVAGTWATCGATVPTTSTAANFAVGTYTITVNAASLGALDLVGGAATSTLALTNSLTLGTG